MVNSAKATLMLTLDDAMEVLVGHDFLDDGYRFDDGGLELVRNELEQKCYMVRSDGKTDEIKADILKFISRIYPKNIAYQIADGTLDKWCEGIRNGISGDMELLLKKL